MTWQLALCVLYGGIALVSALIVLVSALRDSHLRGRRITNEELERERISITLPNYAMRDFKERT